jgi:hypothetical protein
VSHFGLFQNFSFETATLDVEEKAGVFDRFFQGTV